MALSSDLVAVGVLSRQADALGDTYSASLTSAGLNQAAALGLTAALNEITTNNAGVADGVRLPLVAATLHSRIVVKNNAAGTLKVYPGTGESINALAANASFSVAAATATTFCKISTTRWITV